MMNNNEILNIMKVRDMKLLNNIKSGRALKTILINCLKTPDLDVDTLDRAVRVP